MAIINIQRDPAQITAVESTVTEGQVNLADWLDDNIERDLGGLHGVITVNGSVIVNTVGMTPEECNDALDVEVGLFDRVTVVLRPQLDPASIFFIVAIAVGASALAIALTPKPQIPTSADLGATGSRSNNQLNAAGNSYRPGQAIPDIGGEVVSYPDFAQISYYEYQNNKRIFREIVVIGEGQYNVTEVKTGNDLLTDLDGASYTARDQGVMPPNLLNVRTSANSQEVDILAPDDNKITVNFDGVGSINNNTVNLGSTLISALSLTAGDVVDIDISYFSETLGTVTVNASYTIDTFTSTTFTVLSGNFDLGEQLSGSITNTPATAAVPWYILEGDAIQEIWLNLKMPAGIRKGDGTISSVLCTLTIEELNGAGSPTGTTYSRGCTFTGNTQTPQFQTFKLTQTDTIGISGFRAKVERVTNSLGDNASDLVTMEGVAGVTPYTAVFGDVTTLDVTRLSTSRVSRGQSEKLNALVTRKLRIYDNNTDTYGATYETTRRFSDFVFYMLHEKMGVAIADIDTDALFGISDDLSAAELGYFDGTFDDKNVSARDRLKIACGVCRVKVWNQGTLWFFVREESKSIKSMMFNRRNLKAATSKYSQSFHRPADYDSVTVLYVDPVKNAEIRISKKLDAAGAIQSGEGLRALEFNLKLGCRSLAQATNRLELEIRRILYQAIKVSDTALIEALELQLGDRVDWADIYDGDIFDGELLSVAGDVYSTTERFEPVGGVTYYVYITDNTGGVSTSVIATARADGNIFGFEATGLTGAYLASGLVQSGSRYVIASNSDLDAGSFTVIGRGKPNEQGECSIELAEYNELLFSED